MPNEPINMPQAENKTEVREVKLLPKQYKFVHSTSKFNLFSGGRGSSKSTALAWACFKEACKPNNEVLLIRKFLVDLKASTLVVLLEGEDPVIRPEYIEDHNKALGTIKIIGGGVIRYRGLDRGLAVRSINSGCLCIDEAIEFSEEEFEELIYGLRSPYGSRQIFMATNPGSPNEDQWLYRKFYMENNPDHLVINSSSYDNHYLPDDYFKSFRYMNKSRRQRMVDGLWTSIEGMIYDNFDPVTHVKSLPKGTQDYDEFYLGIDWGITNLGAFLLAGVKDGNVYILEEYAKSGLLIYQMKKKICELKDKYNNLQILYDPSAPVLKNELGNIGINLQKANNDVCVGIDRIRNRFAAGSLFIDTECGGLIREIENYCYKPGTESPIKKNDHMCDAMKYIVNCVDDNIGCYIFPSFLDEKEKDTNNEDMWEDINSFENFGKASNIFNE